MATILNSGLFWGAIAAIFAAILGYFANRPSKSAR